MLLRLRINNLKKWRKDICEEFGNFPMFYTIQWFLNQLKQIDDLLENLENITTLK